MSDPAPSAHTAAPGALRHTCGGQTEWGRHLIRHEIFARTDGCHGRGIHGQATADMLRRDAPRAAIGRELYNTTDRHRRCG
jgi:hypothetical protein